MKHGVSVSSFVGLLAWLKVPGALGPSLWDDKQVILASVDEGHMPSLKLLIHIGKSVRARAVFKVDEARARGPRTDDEVVRGDGVEFIGKKMVQLLASTVLGVGT